jgi:hypothetical protein
MLRVAADPMNKLKQQFESSNFDLASAYAQGVQNNPKQQCLKLVQLQIPEENSTFSSSVTVI